MHTKDTMKTGEFGFAQHGAPVKFADVMPDYTIQDRVALVSFRPGGILEAAPLLMASIGAFYEELLSRSDDFYEYPDVFAVHVGGLHGYHGMLDIWPERREVVVPADPNALLGTLSDLGITRLVLQDAPEGGANVEKESITQLARSLKSIYRVGGAAGEDAWSVTPSENAANFIRKAATDSEGILGAEAAEQARAGAHDARTYTPIGFDEALRIIAGSGETAEYFGMSEQYRTALNLGPVVYDRHTYTI
ncbi:hypothetical protein [Leucobacter sp. GX24907]